MGTCSLDYYLWDPYYFCVMDIRLSGLFCIYGSLYGIDLLFMGSMKVNRKKSHAGWQLPLTNYKYIANEPLFYWYQHNPLPLTLYVPRIISRIFWKTNIYSHYDFTYVVHALNSFRNPSPWKSLYFTYIWNLL